MAQYRKKPVIVEAVQYDGANAVEIIEFTNREAFKNGGKSDYLTIQTPEGDMIATTGDWIIKGIKGEFYPCKPDIFEATYEAVSSEEKIDETTTEDTTLDDDTGGSNPPPDKERDGEEQP